MNEFNMVVLFNNMTGVNKLKSGCWENLVDYHYEKFKLLYMLMKKDGFHKSFTFVAIEEEPTCLDLKIQFKSDKKKKLFVDGLMLYLYNSPLSLFDVETDDTGDHLCIRISNKNGLREGDYLDEYIPNSNGKICKNK